METSAQIENNEGAARALNNHVKTILIFTDFSEAAVNATNYATALAQQLKASRIIICYSDFILSAVDIPLEDAIHAEYEHQKKIMQLETLKNELQLQLSEQVIVEVCIEQRSLDLIVNDFGKDRSVGLAVMGIAGKSRLEQTLIGSKTIRVARTSTVPLLIVPEHTAFMPIEKAVFACDLKKVSKATPSRAIKNMIHALGAKLSILNVDHNEKHFNPDTIMEMANLHQLWDNEQPEYYYIENEDIAAGVMDFANTHQMQLVIAVPKEYGFFEGLFHSSLTRKLAYHIHLPLLLFKEEKPR